VEYQSNPHVRSWIILGVTKDDRTFRPSNWAERLCELAITFDDRGLFRYSKDLHPIHFKGSPAVRVSRAFMIESPEIWQQISFFVGLHDLQFVQYISPFDAFMNTVLHQSKLHLFDEVANDSAVALEA
jgi:hypothetical protein